ncbi:MAG: hypothetical protein E4G99_11400 [Anaerolineales bacterium]|nr:MAG: hypothetical protein E4G99_11400 [Anaerolineales bacterium]
MAEDANPSRTIALEEINPSIEPWNRHMRARTLPGSLDRWRRSSFEQEGEIALKSKPAKWPA